MRKPVVLITGAGGEIGHGLVTRLAAIGLADHHARRQPARRVARAARARASSPDRSPTSSLLDRILAEFEVERVFHLAALLSTRAEFTPVTAHHVNVEGTLNLLEFAQREGRVARPPGRVHLPVVDRGVRAAEPRDEDARRPRARGRVHASDDDVRVQQAVLRAARALLRAALQAAVGRRDRRASISARVRFPGLISAMTMPSGGTSDYAPEMIHAAAQGRAVRLLRPAGHDDSVHGDAGRRRRAADARGGAARAADADAPTT